MKRPTISGSSATKSVVQRRTSRDVYLFGKRLVVLTGAAITIYVVAGCFVFPDWWFGLFWGGELKEQGSKYVTDAMKLLLDNHFYLLILSILGICLAGVLGRLFKAHLFRFIDRFGGLFLFTCFMVVMTTALVVYHTEEPSYAALSDTAQILAQFQTIEREIERINAPPPVRAPIDFLYLDEKTVDSLYNEIEPELVRKRVTVSRSLGASAKLRLGEGPALAEAEAAGSKATTSSYVPPSALGGRKCIDVMKYVTANHIVHYYTNRSGWMLRRAMIGLIEKTQEQIAGTPINESKVRALPPAVPLVGSPTSSTQGNGVEAERKAARYEAEMEHELRSLSGLLFVNGQFNEATGGENVVMVETFSTKPHKVQFRFSIPKSQMPDIQGENGVRLRVFGNVIRPLGRDGYVNIQAIAAY